MNNPISLAYLSIKQPIGDLFITVMSAYDLLKCAKLEPRQYNVTFAPQGLNRPVNKKRIMEISKYLDSIDATFPTSVVVSIDYDEDCVLIEDNNIIIEKDHILSIVDGQHRIMALKEKPESFQKEFLLPVVILPYADEETKALVFSIINGKQMKVNSSIIYDLFSVVKKRNPYKTAHYVVLSLNKDSNSPWFKRIKLLGIKQSKESCETVSQGSFVKYLLPLLSKNPADDFRNVKHGNKLLSDSECVLREYFLEDQDPHIYKLMLNYFGSIRSTWPEEWNSSDSIINKTVGVNAFLRIFKEIYNNGVKVNDLTESYFTSIFGAVKEIMSKESKPLTSANYASNEQGASNLYYDMSHACKTVFSKGYAN